MSALIHPFKENIAHLTIPVQFNYPFYYKPHALAVKAAHQLEQDLIQQEWFAPGSKQESGKMFGVLVVKNKQGDLGYLAAFSGKLAGDTTQLGFVPPVYELDRVDAFFEKETAKLDAITKKIKALETSESHIKTVQDYHNLRLENNSALKAEQDRIKRIKKERRQWLKKQQAILTTSEYESVLARQRQLSLNNNFFLKEYEVYLNHKIAPLEAKFLEISEQLEALKTKRREGSNWLQDWLFDQYNFLNAQGEQCNVKALFTSRSPDTPPAATGDCAAPKLLQYAYQHQLEPITMAEFWYGPSPKSKIRKQGNFYPSCRSKCEPVLEFMLQGLDVEDNPLLEAPTGDKTIEILFEDEHLTAINKPADFLSVPGKTISDCVQSRMKKKYPTATGPLIVHRLDMATSGILLIAKSLEVYHDLQEQFTKRTVKKRYVALLEGIVRDQAGEIDLPLRVDMDNRPYQLVDPVYGKRARTRYKVQSQDQGITRIHFFPITGRTHQLRVHAAHVDGLGTPILGDDLYGRAASRMHLHADKLVFQHPLSRKRITIHAPAPF